MQVTYPMTEDVYASEFRGNLAPIKTIFENHNFGNICPVCKSYQGAHFVWMEFANNFSYDLEKYLIGYFEIKVNCLICGKPLEDSSTDIHTMLSLYEDYHYVEHSEDEDKEEALDDRKVQLDPAWVCTPCIETANNQTRKSKKNKTA